jgi:hypothetical protein
MSPGAVLPPDCRKRCARIVLAIERINVYADP